MTNAMPANGSTIYIIGVNCMIVSSENGERSMQCNRVKHEAWEHFRVEHYNGLISFKSMEKYVSSENGEKSMTCNRHIALRMEMFLWVPNPDGTFSLQGNNHKWVSIANDGTMACNRTKVTDYEKFIYKHI